MVPVLGRQHRHTCCWRRGPERPGNLSMPPFGTCSVPAAMRSSKEQLGSDAALHRPCAAAFSDADETTRVAAREPCCLGSRWRHRSR